MLASGYCRAIEMARLAFGHVETSDALLLQNFVPVAGAPVPPPWPQRVEAMKTMLATVPEAPTNTILITHFPNVKAALGLQVEFGDAVIVKPDGQGAARMVARIFANEWPCSEALRLRRRTMISAAFITLTEYLRTNP